MNQKTTSELLPIQSSYFLLSDGKKYAIHGISPLHYGVLVFPESAQAHWFVQKIGYRLPQFQPVKVSAKELIRILNRKGNRFCVRNDKGTFVATLNQNQRTLLLGKSPTCRASIAAPVV